MSDFKQETSSFNAFIPKKWQDTGWSQGDLSNTLLRSARPGLKEPGLKDGVAALGLRGDELKTKPATLADAQSIPAAQDDRSPRAKEDAPAITQARPPEPPQAAQPIIVNPAMKSSTPAFAPVLAAGALSALMKDRAAAPDSTAKKMDNNPSKAFQYGMVEDGSEAARARRYHNTTDELIHQYDAADSNNDFYYQYMMQQQFMQSQEYGMALETSRQYLQNCKTSYESALKTYEEARERAEADAERVRILQEEQNKDVTRKEELEELDQAKTEHDQQVVVTEEAQVNRDIVCSTVDEVRQKAIQIDGANTYVTVKENGQNVTYRVGENGYEKVEGERKVTSDENLVFRRAGENGAVEYVDSKGNKVSQEQADQINKSLKAVGKTPEEAIPTYDNYKEIMTKSGVECGASEDYLKEQKEKEAKTEANLKATAERVGYPLDQIHNLRSDISALEVRIGERGAKLEEAIREGKLSAAEAAKAQKQLEIEQQKYEQAKEFNRKLEAGEFKSREEMEAAMPAAVRAEYENKRQAQAPAQAQAPTTTEPVNTSRTNGSAAPPAIASSKDVSSDFASASQGTAPANANSPAPEQAPEKKVAATAPVAAPAP
ncbi:MAG: hypothetical protein NDJ24_08190 [Alphaproteobacteria bacterium]|nr:hypothetical protein [Alphaproteobacteria bacterium]